MEGLKGFASVAAGALLLFVAKPAMSTEVVYVTSNADSGQGSFRAAVRTANTHSIVHTIEFRLGPDRRTIELLSAVIYTGAQALTIDGQGATIDGRSAVFAPGLPDEAPDEGLLHARDGGGDLTLERLRVQGSAENGVLVEVPADAEDEILVRLHHVGIIDNDGFGLLVDDLTAGSAATVALEIERSQVMGNGLAATDLDGVRVDEGGDGDIIAMVRHAEITGNGADGLELDESDDGDVMLFVRRSRLDDNGALFHITGIDDDADDGLDVDEAGDGSAWIHVARTTLNDNTDDGVGVDEVGNGSVHLTLFGVEASGSGDKGVSADEGDDGDFRVRLDRVRAEMSGDDGLKLEETGAGDFVARVARSVLSDNDEDGANLEESGDGDLWARVVRSRIGDNAEFGIKIEQADDGEGELRLRAVRFGGNGEGPIDATGVVVIDASS